MHTTPLWCSSLINLPLYVYTVCLAFNISVSTIHTGNSTILKTNVLNVEKPSKTQCTVLVSSENDKGRRDFMYCRVTAG